MRKLIDEHGNDKMKRQSDEIVKWITQPQRRPKNLDDWAACRAEKLEDLRDLFIPNFYYGCEADDPMVAWAFNSKVNPMGVKFKAMMSSDIGHWDVTDMSEVVEEAHELVAHGLITEEDFRDYTFANAATLYARMNPDFFKGTVCETAVTKLLQSASQNAAQGFQHDTAIRLQSPNTGYEDSFDRVGGSALDVHQ